MATKPFSSCGFIKTLLTDLLLFNTKKNLISVLSFNVNVVLVVPDDIVAIEVLLVYSAIPALI